MSLTGTFKNITGLSHDSGPYDMDDLIIRRTWIELDGNELKYLLFDFDRDVGNGLYDHVYKAIRLVKIKRVPKKDLTLATFLQMQAGVVTGYYQNQINYIQLFANIIRPKRLGLIFGYGVQGISDLSIEEAKLIADEQMEAVERTITGTFRTLEYVNLSAEDAQWIFQKLTRMQDLRILRGIPQPKKTEGRSTATTFFGTESEAVEEQSEEFLLGMDKYEYLFVLMASSVDMNVLSAWREQQQKEMTYYKSIESGSRAITAGVSMPMVYGSNLGSSQGWGNSQSENWGTSESVANGTSETLSEGTSHSVGTGTSHSISEGVSHSVSNGTSSGSTTSFGTGTGASQNAGTNFGESLGNNLGYSSNTSSSYGDSNSISHGTGMNSGFNLGVNDGTNSSTGTNTSYSESTGTNHSVSDGTSHSVSNGTSSSHSTGVSSSAGGGSSWGTSTSESWGTDSGHSSAFGGNGGFELGIKVGGSYTDTNSTGANHSISTNATSGGSSSWSSGSSEGWTSGTSHTVTDGTSHTVSDGTSNSVSHGTGTSTSNGVSHGNSQGGSVGSSVSDSISSGLSSSHSAGYSNSLGSSYGQSYGASLGSSLSASKSQSESSNVGTSFSESSGTSSSISNGTSTSESYGTSESVSHGKSYTESTGTTASRGIGSSTSGSTSSGISSSMGMGPSLSFSRQFAWQDIEVTHILDLLAYSTNRIIQGTTGSGMFFTDVYIACESSKAAQAATSLAMSSWHGPMTLTCPLQVYQPSAIEREYLFKHLSVFSPSTLREGVPGRYESYKYSTLLLPEEIAAYSHPPRANIGGIVASVDDPPVLSIPGDRQYGEIFLGYVGDVEKHDKKNGYKSTFPYTLRSDELHHCYISGASRSGKTVLARRLVAEAYEHVRRGEQNKRMRFLIMDPKQDWRALAKVVPNDHFRFYSLSDPTFHPIRMNLMKIPKGVFTERYADKLREIFIRSYGLGDRGFQLFGKAIRKVYKDAGCYEDQVKFNKPDPVTGLYPATERSKDITLEDVCIEMQNMIANVTARDQAEAIQRVLDRMENFMEKDSSIYTVFCNRHDGMGIDDLLGADDVIVLESYGMDTKTSGFIFGLITSGVYQYAVSNGGFVKPDNQYETVLVIEEANQVLITEDQDMLGGANPFEIILDQSAGYGLFIWTLTQKIADMPRSVLANSAIKMIGRQDDKDDIERSIVQIGKDGLIADRVFKNWLPDQPTGWFIIKSSRNRDFVKNAPCHVLVEYLDIEPPTDDELSHILAMGDIERTSQTANILLENFK